MQVFFMGIYKYILLVIVRFFEQLRRAAHLYDSNRDEHLRMLHINFGQSSLRGAGTPYFFCNLSATKQTKLLPTYQLSLLRTAAITLWIKNSFGSPCNDDLRRCIC